MYSPCGGKRLRGQGKWMDRQLHGHVRAIIYTMDTCTHVLDMRFGYA